MHSRGRRYDGDRVVVRCNNCGTGRTVRCPTTNYSSEDSLEYARKVAENDRSLGKYNETAIEVAPAETVQDAIDGRPAETEAEVEQ